MSYTAPDQRIDEPMDELLASIEKVRNVLWARVRDDKPSDWADDHIADCHQEIRELTDLELRLRKKFG